MIGPTEFTLESPDSARLIAGRVSVRAPEEVMGLTLYTPDGTAVDFGTEFVVSVSRGPGTELSLLKKRKPLACVAVIVRATADRVRPRLPS